MSRRRTAPSHCPSALVGVLMALGASAGGARAADIPLATVAPPSPVAVPRNPGATSLRAMIPAFARKYRTTCSTCHAAPPKLNVMGEAFRLNGYRFPKNDELLRRDRPVEQGAEPWKDLWPRAIWPGEIPGSIPLALRIVNDMSITAEPDATAVVDFQFPNEVYVLAGASLGETFGAFLSAEWTPSGGIQAVQAKVEVKNLVGSLPDRALNLWVGLQNLYLFTFADRQIDRAGRLSFRWQTFRPSEIDLRDVASGETLASANEFRLRDTQAAIELNGIGGGRFYYAVGLTQGAGAISGDNNARKDFYYKLRYKAGGLRLDGTYPEGVGPVLGGGGQLMDRGLIVEHFGYFGGQPVAGGRDDTHRAFGINARLLHGPLDVGVGYVWGRHESPWGDLLTGELTHRSVFGKAEYFFYPWLLGSLKLDIFDVDTPDVAGLGLMLQDSEQTRIVPGAVLLLRHNVKVVLEGELFARHSRFDETGARRPHTLWLRLDVAF